MRNCLLYLMLLIYCVNVNAQQYIYVHKTNQEVDVHPLSKVKELSHYLENGQYFERILIGDSIVQYSVKEVDSLRFVSPSNVLQCLNYNGWDNVRFSKDANSCLYFNEKTDKNISEFLAFIPLEDGKTRTCYARFSDEESVLPSVIVLDNIYMYTTRISDEYVNVVTVIDDSIYLYTDSVYISLQPKQQNRAWGENNAIRNTCATIATITGAVGITLGVIALLPEVVATETLVAAAIGITTGITAVMDGVSTLFVPADSHYNLSQGAATTIETITFDGISNGLNPSIAGGANSGIGAIAGIFNLIFGKTVSHSDRIKIIESGIVTGLVKDVTSTKATVRGYINPIIFLDPLSGKKVDYYYGMMLQESSSNSTPTTGSFDGIFDKRENNGSGGLLEYEFEGLMPNTEYEYFVYYRDKTNSISVFAPSRFFTTNDIPVEITDFSVTNSEWKRNGFEVNGQNYQFKYNCSVTATLTDVENIEDWGYAYMDPNGDVALISLSDRGNTFTDTRYSYCRNEDQATVILYGYVKYKGQEDIVYGQGWEYPVVYEEEPGISFESAEITSINAEPKTDGSGNYLFTWYTTGMKYIIRINGGYWIDYIQPIVYNNGSWTYNGSKTRVPGDGLYSVNTNLDYDNEANMNWSTGYAITLTDGSTIYTSNEIIVGGTPDNPTVSVGTSNSAKSRTNSKGKIKESYNDDNIKEPKFGIIN